MDKKSENIIIHTTSTFAILKSILESKSLKLSFSSEDFYCQGKLVSQAAHPMVCFSEYNPDTIDSEKITYGKYAVGFSKKWAKDSKIGPVLYVSDTSVAAKGMNELLKARRKKPGVKMLKGNIRLAIMEVKCFMKNETGLNSHNGDKKFNFKSENEWRYVPQKSKIDKYFISQNQSTYKKNKDKHNKKLEKFPLKFTFGDLVAIYVETANEKELIHNLFNIHKDLIKLSKWQTT